MAELEIVVRARDQLTASLRAMGTSVGQFARESVTALVGADKAVDGLSIGLGTAAAQAGTLGGEAKAAVDATSALDRARADGLTASIAKARAELNALRRDARGRFLPADAIPPETAARAAELTAQVKEAEQSLRQLGSIPAPVQATRGIGELRDSILSARTEIDRLRAAGPVSPESVARVQGLEEVVRQAETALEDLSGVDIDITRKIAQAEQAFERLGSEASLVPLQVEIGRARAELDRLRAAADAAGGEMSQLDRTRIDQLTRGIREGEQAIIRMRNGAESVPPAARNMGTAFTTAGAAIKSALLPLIPIFGLAGAAFFAKKAAEDSLAFEAALGQIKTEGIASGAELAALGETARATARALGLSDANAAPALLAAVTDGAASAADGLDRYNAAIRLATVTGGDVKRTTDVLTSALNAYARQGLGAARAADVLFEVSRAGKVEIDALAGGLEGILPLASQLGISFESLGAVLVTATRQGGGFEQGVQAIRATLGALSNISDEGAEALRGIDYSAAAIRARGLVPVLSDISARLEGNSDAIRAVFPDGRSFGALLAVLANDGRDLSDALYELEGASGAVEDAVGRKLQSPMVQLGIIINSLRSSLGARLGAAFTDAVSRAVSQLGGLEAAARKIGDIGAIIGAGLGSGLGVLGEVIGDQAARLSLFIDRIGGADAIVSILEQSARTAASSIGVALVVTREFFKLTIDGLATVKAGWQALLLTLRAIPGVDLALEGLDALAESPAEAQAKVAALNRELAFLQDGLAKANAQKLSIAPDDTAGLVLIGSRIKDFEDRIASVRGKIEQLGTAFDFASRADALFGGDQFSRLKQDADGLLAVLQGIEKPREIAVELDLTGDLESSLTAAEERAELFRRSLADLRRQAEAALGRGFTQDTLRTFLTELARRAALAREGLNESTESAAQLRAELAKALQGDLSDKRAQLEQLRSGLLETSSAAELLGISAEAAAQVLDGGFTANGIAAVEAEIAALEEKLNALRGSPVTITPKIEIPETIVTAGRDGLVLPVQLVAGVDAIAQLQRALSGIEPPDVFRQMEERFRGGIEPSLERQANAIDRQVARQRTSLTLLRALGVLDVTRLATLEQATDELDKQADSLRDQAANVRRGLRLEAIQLGIDPNLDESELRAEIERVRDRASLESAALRLGVSIDLDDEALTAAIRDAQTTLDEGIEEIRRGALEREAIQLGVSLESDNLELDVARARDQAQSFADTLQGEGLRREAITLGIGIEGRSVEQIRQDIAGVRNEADAFAAQNPITSDALVSGIRGFSNAIGQIASGAQTAREAMSSFFQSFVQQVASAIAQALLLRAIIASVGGTGSGVGAFLATTFGVPAKDGAVIPAARGMAVPGLAAAALAMAPVVAFAQGGTGQPSGNPGQFGAGQSVQNLQQLAPVYAFAQGGAPSSPHLDRIVSAPTYAPLASLAGSAVVPLSGGGVETTGGERIPVKRQGGELVVAAARGLSVTIPGPVVALAQGAAQALYGEAGPEAIMRTYRAPGGGPGLRAASGEVLPLTRVAGGRLGLAMADGAALPDLRRSVHTDAVPFALGGIHDLERAALTSAVPFRMGAVADASRSVRSEVVPFALGGAPDADRTIRTSVLPFALGAARDATRGVDTVALPFALGGVPALSREIRTGVVPFAAGGAPDLKRSLRTYVLPFATGAAFAFSQGEIRPFALGGTPGAPGRDGSDHFGTPIIPMAQGYTASPITGLRAPVLPLALGGLPAAAAQVIQARPTVPVNVSVPVSVNVAGGGAAPGAPAQEDPKQIEARLQAAISGSSRIREAIAAVVSREMEARPTFRANVRGDRA